MKRRVIFPLALIFTSIFAVIAGAQTPPAPVPETPASLIDARKTFHTAIIKDTRSDNSPHEDLTSGPYRLMKYASPAGMLGAYLTVDPNDHKKHPAVIWVHGGFGGSLDQSNTKAGSDDNDQSPHFFQEAGFVTMIPTWRGEGDNPGKPEIFYGEVDDLLAAIRHVRALPYVDPTRVYLVGHSTGGTLSLLAAEASNDLRAVFDFGGNADVAKLFTSKNVPKPFDVSKPDEIRLRSAIHFAGRLTTPVFCIEGSMTANKEDFPQLQANADAGHAPLRTYVIPYGTHFSILHPITKVLADKMLADDGPTCNITLTQDELNKAFDAFLDNLVKARATLPITITPSAATRIALAGAASNMDTAWLHVQLSDDGRISCKVTGIHVGSELTYTINGIHVAVDAATNRACPSFTLDVDPSTQKLRITRP